MAHPPFWKKQVITPLTLVVPGQWPSATHQNVMAHDDDAKAWYQKQETTAFDLVGAVSFYLSAGWQTTKLVEFLDIIKPMAGWLDEIPEGVSSDDPALTSDNHKALRAFIFERYNEG